MKKEIILALMSAGLAAHATDFTNISGDITVNSAVEAVATSTVNITGAGTMSFSNPSYAFTLNFLPASGDVNLINASADYNINGKLVLASPVNQTGEIWTYMYQNAGNKLTISDLIYDDKILKSSRKKRNNFCSNSYTALNAKTATTADFENTRASYYVNTSNANTFMWGSSRYNNEIWLRMSNFHAQAAVHYGYVHFSYGSRFVVETDNITIGTAAIRQPTIETSDRAEADADPSKSFAGYIDLNGHSLLKINSLYYNPKRMVPAQEECVCHDFYIDFGENNNVAQVCYIGFLYQTAHITDVDGTGWRNYFLHDRLYIKNASVGDTIVFADWLSNQTNYETILRNTSNLDYKIEQLTEDTYSGKYAMVFVVPEPATYATIFGALALGAALYRKRK